jgi:hypothetical protein
MRDRAPSPAPASEPSPPVGPARVHGADRLAAALSTVPRAVSEDAPDAAPVQADRPVDLRVVPPTPPTPPTPPAVAAAPSAPAPPVASTTVGSGTPGSSPEQRSARLDALLRPSEVEPDGTQRSSAPTEARAEVPSQAPSHVLTSVTRPEPGIARAADRTPPRPAPQSLRLAPDPTTTVWCADLLAAPAARPPVPPATPTLHG